MQLVKYIFISFLVFTSCALSADVAEPKSQLPKDFLGLSDLRSSLNSDIYYLDTDIQELEKKANELNYIKSDLERTKARSAEISKKQKPSEDEIKWQSESEWRIQNMEQQIKIIENSLPTLNSKKEALKSKKRLYAEVQDKIANMLSPEQAFKRTMSITFAMLIGIVIIGFFVIAWLDENIRRAIFSGQAGIQFLTLFSLVIAIILFGITGILEGKELAALLGGLSGYILGRVTTVSNGGNS